MPYLVYADGNGKASVHEIAKDRTTIGRNAENDLSIPFDNLVSRAHCTVERRGAAFVVVDPGSRFGTYLDGERVTGERPLPLGATLRVGNTAVRLVETIEREPTTESAPAAEVSALERLLSESMQLATELSRHLDGEEGIHAQIAGELVKHISQTVDAYREVEVTQRLSTTLTEVGKLINLVTDLDTVLRLTLEMGARALDAERGMLLLKEDGKLAVRSAHRMGEERGISASIAEKVVEDGAAVLTTDARIDARFRESDSVMINDIRAVMCVPMRDKSQKVIGAIYVDGRVGTPGFSARGLEFLNSFANQAAISIESARLAAKSAREEAQRERLSRYFSPSVVADIVAGKEAERLGGSSRAITCLFTDLRGFTTFSEQLRPAEAVEMLNDYFSEIVEDILAEEGTLDKFTGDGIMAFWNAPKDQPDHALRAIRAATKMQARMARMLTRWAKEGRSFLKAASRLSTGIGIHSGEAIIGNIGSPKRMEYTSIGDSVNLTARVCGVAEGGEVLITDDTLRNVRGRIQFVELPAVHLKGKSATVPIYRVVSVLDG